MNGVLISKKFTLMQTTFLAWFVGFVFMWVVIGNLGVLPYGLLVMAVPHILPETFVAALIIVKMKNQSFPVQHQQSEIHHLFSRDLFCF